MSGYAKSSSSRSVTHRLLVDALRREGRLLEDARRACRKRPTPTRIHAVRVATRRLLAPVALAEIVDSAKGKALRKALRRLLKVTGKARDLQVQLRLVETQIPRHPELRPFRRQLRKKARRAALHVGPGLSQGRTKELLGLLVQALAKCSGGGDLERRLRRELRAVIARVPRSRVAGSPTAKAFHLGRLAVKEARYLAETLHPVFVPDRGRWVRDLQRRQRLTGEIHDLQNLVTRLLRYVERKRSGKPALQPVLRQLGLQGLQRLRTYRTHRDVTPPSLRRGDLIRCR